jgi:hypothetical protein
VFGAVWFCLVLFGGVWCCLVLFGGVWCVIVLCLLLCKFKYINHTNSVFRKELLFKIFFLLDKYT